ncbi:MAG TPA: hypothetical protein VIX37_06425 [Candidatus Sulfotelmatobacter sp.]
MPIGGTASIGENQSPRITTTYLNQFGRQGDPTPGALVSTAQVSGSIVQPYSGFEGGKTTITNPFAGAFADPSVGPLYGGVHQYVRFSPNSTVAAIRAQLVFWLDPLNYIVTPDISAAAVANGVAGVAINATARGNWDFIQVAGIAMIQFAAVTAGAIGSIVTRSGASATVVAAPIIDQNFIGFASLSIPVANQINPVRFQALYNY